MRNKFKNYIALVLILFSLMLLTGCQLAREEAGEAQSSDRLVGVFITMEYLDLFDTDRFLNDNLGAITNSGEVITSNNALKYNGRLYANLKEISLINDDTGEVTTHHEYAFEGVEGLLYFYALVPPIDGMEPYSTMIADDSINDSKTALFYGDNEDRLELEGTVYTAPSILETTYYINPVYQGADGRVYAESGGGFMRGMTSDGEGEIYSQTLTSQTTQKENGTERTVTSSVKITLSLMMPPTQIIVFEMDSDSQIISQKAYTPGTLPEQLYATPETEYFIIETQKQSAMGGQSSFREIYSKKDEMFPAFYCREDGICVKTYTGIMWPD